MDESDDRGTNICKALIETVFRIKRYINPEYYYYYSMSEVSVSHFMVNNMNCR